MIKKLTMILALPTVLAVACSTSTSEPTWDPTFAKRIPDAAGLSNIARISSGLYRGAEPTERGYATLEKMGIKTVISFRRFNSSRKDVERAGLEYVGIPIMASVGSKPPRKTQLKRFFDTVFDPSKQPVYIHCKYGKDRTGMMAALYRIEHEGWTNSKAIEEMQAFGYHNFFRDLIGYVRDYQPRGFKPPEHRQN